MQKTNIAWCDVTWNPVTGCSPVSEGCKNCYAQAMAARFNGGDFGIQLHPDRLDEPLKRKKPSKIFVCSMSDLFHEEVPFGFIHDVFKVIYYCPQHQFQILTKRPKRPSIFDWQCVTHGLDFRYLKNLWLGVTCENQRTADERIPLLLQVPAAVRFLSLEPLLEEINIAQWLFLWGDPFKEDRVITEIPVDWVIIGCESGANRRPCKLEWVRLIVRQCKDADVPVFVKQLDIDGKVVHEIKKFPKDLQIREWPYAKA